MIKKFALCLAAMGALMTTAVPSSAQVGVSVRIGAPPAPIVERVPVAPGPGYFWRPGHWFWNGGRYVWVRGGYIARPYGGAAWIPGHWQHGPRRWFWVEGHWR